MPTHTLALAFMIILALAVTAATQVVGVLMIFSLLITPAAIAERLTTRPPLILLYAMLLAVFCTWIGLFIAFYVPYPVSFFITSLVFLIYVLVRVVPLLAQWLRRLLLQFQGGAAMRQQAQTMTSEPL